MARHPHLIAVAVVSGVVICSREGGHSSHHAVRADCTALSAEALCSASTNNPVGVQEIHQLIFTVAFV